MIDYYKVLGISRSASLKDIKRAYKREAFRWHPDKNSSHDAKERMRLINEARLILTDIEARTRYDREFECYQSFVLSKSNEFGFKDDYVFNDETILTWMENAKKQSQTLAKASLDDLVGISAAAMMAFYAKTKYWILLYIVIVIVFSLR